MKKLISLMLAIMLIFSSVAVASAQEVDVAETTVNTYVFDQIADYIVSEGTATNSGYRLTCSYNGYSCNLFFTDSGDLQIRFSNESSNLLTTGNITYYKYDENADVYLSAIYSFYSADFRGEFNAQTLTENYDKEQLSITNIDYSGDDIFKMEQLLTTAENSIVTYSQMVELHLMKNLGYGLSDIYNENESSNDNNNTDSDNNDSNETTPEDNKTENSDESTPDAITPTPSTQDNAPIAPATPKTGHNTYAVALISLMVIAGAFAIFNSKKNSLTK